MPYQINPGFHQITSNHPLAFLQMSIRKSRSILQAVPKHAIHSDMSEPDDADCCTNGGLEGVTDHQQEKRKGVGMKKIVRNGADAFIDSIAQHRKIRGKKEDDK